MLSQVQESIQKEQQTKITSDSNQQAQCRQGTSEQYESFEMRHRALINEMPNSIDEKNKEISALKEMTKVKKLSITLNEEPMDKSPSKESNVVFQEIQINTLCEGIEERDAVILLERTLSL